MPRCLPYDLLHLLCEIQVALQMVMNPAMTAFISALVLHTSINIERLFISEMDVVHGFICTLNMMSGREAAMLPIMLQLRFLVIMYIAPQYTSRRYAIIL